MIDRRFATWIEIVGILTIICGVSLELYFQADIYLGVITVGSAVIAFGGLLYAKIVKDG